MNKETVKENQEIKNKPFMSVNAQVEGAFMAVFSIIIGLLTLNPLFFLFTFLGPLPSMLLVLRRGVKAGFLGALVAGCVFSILTGLENGIVFIIQYNLVGLAMGMAIKTKWSPGKILVIGTITSTAGVILITFIGFFLMGIEIQPVLQEGRESYIEIFKTLNVDAAQIEEFNKVLDIVTADVKILIMGLFITAVYISFPYILFVYILSQKILKRVGHDLTPFAPFKLWRIPWYYSWLLIGAFIFLWKSNSTMNFWFFAGMWILFSSMIIYFIPGASVGYFFIDKLTAPKFAKILLLISLIFILGNMFSFLGLFDSWWDLRRLDVKNDEKKEEKTTKKGGEG